MHVCVFVGLCDGVGSTRVVFGFHFSFLWFYFRNTKTETAVFRKQMLKSKVFHLSV